MKGNRLGICVVGLGIGIEHVKAYARMDDIDIYLCDTDPTRLEKARSEFKVAGAFSSVDDAIASASVDAIDASLPNSLHLPVAVSAASHGKHCLMEKPFAMTLKEADTMIASARSAGRILGIAENWQFSPSNLKAIELIRAGELGNAFFVSETAQMWPIYFPKSSWWFRREMTGGGILLNGGVHAIRTLRMLGGSDIRDVYAVGTGISLGMGTEDTCVVSINFSSGIVGLIVASWAAPNAPSLFEVHGTRGTMTCARDGNLTIKANKVDSTRNEKIEVPKLDTYEEECRVFVQSIRNGVVDERISAEQGRKDLEVVEAAYRSMANKEIVKLPL